MTVMEALNLIEFYLSNRTQFNSNISKAYLLKIRSPSGLNSRTMSFLVFNTQVVLLVDDISFLFKVNRKYCILSTANTTNSIFILNGLQQIIRFLMPKKTNGLKFILPIVEPIKISSSQI